VRNEEHLGANEEHKKSEGGIKMSKEILQLLEEKRLTRRSLLKGIGLTAGTVALSSVIGFRSFATPPFPVKVGTLYAHTGALAEFGPNFVNAAELAALHLNEAWKEIDPTQDQIVLTHEDSETDPGPAVEAARKLVEVEQVSAISGALASGVTIPVAVSVTIPTRTLQISPASTSPSITDLPEDEEADMLFRTCPSDALQGVIAGKLAAELGYKTASVLYVNNPYGFGLMDQFKKSFEFRGGKVLATVPHPEEVIPSYVAELSQCLEPELPDMLYCLSYPGHATIYMKEAIEVFDYIGKGGKFFFCDGTKSLEIPQAVGPENVEEMWGTAPGSALSPSYDTFIAEYGRVYGAPPPLPFMTNTYDSIAVIGLASHAAVAAGAKELTGEVLRDHLRAVATPNGETIGAGKDAFKKAFETLREGGEINYEGAAGSVDFDEHGDVVTPIEVWKYVGGVPTTVRLEFEIPEI